MAASPAGATPVIVPKPQPVPLTPEEKVLFDRIDFELSGEYESRMESLAAAADLAESLIARDAIPEVRRRYLTDPELNVSGRNKSRIAGFELNGVQGRGILAHPNFLRYLRYFLFGPDLPEASIELFRKILIDDTGTSGMILDALCRCARAEARRLRRYDAAEEFFKLALECGVDEGVARSVRDSAMRAR
jgi:hypothetical protein